MTRIQTRLTSDEKRPRRARSREVTPDQSSQEDAPPVSLDVPQEGEVVSFEDVIADACSDARFIRATTHKMVTVHHPGERLEGLNYPSGLGGYTHYGVAFIVDWREVQEPFFVSPNMDDARAVFLAVEEEREVSWGVTRATNSEEDEDTPRSKRPTSDDGDGSPAPSDSSGRHTGGSSQLRSLAKRARSRRTSSRR